MRLCPFRNMKELYPINFQKCIKDDCMLWDDEYNTCVFRLVNKEELNLNMLKTDYKTSKEKV